MNQLQINGPRHIIFAELFAEHLAEQIQAEHLADAARVERWLQDLQLRPAAGPTAASRLEALRRRVALRAVHSV